tara:strand:- start:6547 stop:7635 length:1089 start_codon:yes stop_codon:yes gene_type:complete
MANIFLIDLEAVDTRYTGQWKTHVPKLLEEAGHNVTVIEGPSDIPNATTPGAFLNFGGTNIYKARQVEELSRLFTSGKIHSGDHVIFTDAWHPGIINLKYMSELLGIKVTIHALWHAGSYDPQDFLGRLIGDANWVRHTECAFFEAIDHNYFATDFHINMFCENLLGLDIEKEMDGQMAIWRYKKKIVRTGWPMEYMPKLFEEYSSLPKRNLILFPHRLAPEKQVDIFNDLAEAMPQYEFVVCQNEQLTKDQYHTLLGQAKLVFSANLQETLGISMYEGALCNTTPLVPDRLSYSEMYSSVFKYPTEYTESWDSYLEYKQELMDAIEYHIENYESVLPKVKAQGRILDEKFFSASAILENIE